MKAIYAVLISLMICAIAALLEGLCAGKNVKTFFATLKFPRHSAPLWVWSIIGAGYYLIFFFILFRLLRLNAHTTVWYVALLLVLFMMMVNGLSNYVIFRLQNLRLSFIIGAVFPVFDITLFILLIQLDSLAVWFLAPYLLYRIYAVWWGHAVWRINQATR